MDGDERVVIVIDELVEVLGHERHLLENLVFRLIEARGLLATGEARFLGWAASDIEAASAAVREIELRRATVLGGLEQAPPPTMAELLRRSEEPWSTILDDHRLALGRLAGEVGAALEATHELASAGLERVRAASPSPDGAVDEVGDHLTPRWTRVVAAGARRDPDSPIQRRNQPFADLDELDREITAAGYEAVQAATVRMGLPSLVSFLA